LGLPPTKEIINNKTVLNWASFLQGIPSEGYEVFNWDELYQNRTPTSYFEWLAKAKKVTDYSLLNKEVYKNPVKKWSWMKDVPFKLRELEVFKWKPVERKKDIKFLFYGAYNTRREKVLKRLRKHSHLIRNRFMGEKEQIELLERSEYLIDVQYYGHPHTNNSLRIIPALSYGCKVIAEECDEEWFNEKIKKLGAEVLTYEQLCNL